MRFGRAAESEGEGEVQIRFTGYAKNVRQYIMPRPELINLLQRQTAWAWGSPVTPDLLQITYCSQFRLLKTATHSYVMTFN